MSLTGPRLLCTMPLRFAFRTMRMLPAGIDLPLTKADLRGSSLSLVQAARQCVFCGY